MYIHPCVSTDKVLAMLQKLQTLGTEVHQFCMYYKGEKMLEFAPAPYRCEDKRRVNSVSKTFTPTAVGLCFDRGLLKPEDLLVSFFPEEMTRNADPKLARLTLHELLTMQTAIEDRLSTIDKTGEVVSGLLSHTYASNVPGFAYNNTATYLLSAVVTRLTGCTVLDYLRRELFPALGIRGFSWPTLDGVTEGAAGLRVCADDICRLMLLYSNGGMWHGKQLLSTQWVEIASAAQVSTEFDNTFRWSTQGYGYQIWRNYKDGYRATGAGGQYGFVFPTIDVVLGHEGAVQNNDETDDLYYSFCADFQGTSSLSAQDLEQYINTMYLPLSGNLSGFEGFEKDYALNPNDLGFTLLRLSVQEDAVECEFSDGEYLQSMTFGRGKWIENKIFAHNFRPELYGLTIPRREVVHFEASCQANADGILEVMLRFRDCNFHYRMTIAASETLELQFHTSNLTDGAKRLSGHAI